MMGAKGEEKEWEFYYCVASTNPTSITMMMTIMMTMMALVTMMPMTTIVTMMDMITMMTMIATIGVKKRRKGGCFIIASPPLTRRILPQLICSII